MYIYNNLIFTITFAMQKGKVAANGKLSNGYANGVIKSNGELPKEINGNLKVQDNNKFDGYYKSTLASQLPSGTTTTRQRVFATAHN